MEELKENRNIFTINGYLGRKWYFILGILVAIINMLLMAILCKEIFVQIFELAKTNETYSIINILTSGAIPYEQLVAYVILYVFSAILSFINNKKRITDIMGAETYSYLISAIITAVTVVAIFIPTISILYSIIIFALTICSFFMLFYPGKFSNKNEEQTICDDNEVETKTVVSFWKRWFAYIIDATFILGGISSLVAISLPDTIIRIGDYSALIGLILTFAYFGIMNSEICKGQTLGKNLMGLKVVNKNGNYLTLPQSLVRTLILIICLTIPYSFIVTLSFKTPNIPETFLGIAAITAGIIFDLLFLFNFKTRQTLHDLAVGSYVTNTKYNCKLSDNKISSAPVIFAIIPAFLIAFPMLMATKTLEKQLIDTNSPAYKKAEYIKNMENDLNAKITKLEKVNTNIGTNYVVIVFSTNINDEDFANNIKAYIDKNKDSDEKITSVVIVLSRIINLGNIATAKQKVYKFENKPDGVDK